MVEYNAWRLKPHPFPVECPTFSAFKVQVFQENEVKNSFRNERCSDLMECFSTSKITTVRNWDRG